MINNITNWNWKIIVHPLTDSSLKMNAGHLKLKMPLKIKDMPKEAHKSVLFLTCSTLLSFEHGRKLFTLIRALMSHFYWTEVWILDRMFYILYLGVREWDKQYRSILFSSMDTKIESINIFAITISYIHIKQLINYYI